MPRFGQPEELQEATQWQFPPMRISAPRDIPYSAEATDATIGPMAVFKISSTQAQLLRSPRMISSGDQPYLKVILHRSGSLIASQDDRQAKVSPGELFVFDTSRPYELVSLNPCDLIAVGMPRSMAGPSADLISRRAAVPVPADRGIRSVIATFFAGLADTGPAGEEIRGPDTARLADAAASLVVTAFTGIPGERVELPTALTDRILSYTLANLHDPRLSVSTAARRFGISTRYLQSLMQARGIQFTAWLRRERLKRVRQDLLDPRLANYTAAAIAARWGILDPNHLSRALRAQYGQSAAEIRAASRPA